MSRPRDIRKILARHGGALEQFGSVVVVRGEMLSLTDMWRAAGSDDARRPANWARKEGVKFIKHIKDVLNVPLGLLTANRGFLDHVALIVNAPVEGIWKGQRGIDGMGLAWEPQRQRLLRHPIFSKGTRIIKVPFGPGGAQDTLCLNLRYVEGWLFGIETPRIKDEQVRATVEAFQLTCCDVLHDHFNDGKAQPRHLPNLEDMDAEEPEIGKLRAVAEARLVWGVVVAREVWLAKSLIRTPSMSKPPVQPELSFTYTAIRQDPPKGEEAA